MSVHVSRVPAALAAALLALLPSGRARGAGLRAQRPEREPRQRQHHGRQDRPDALQGPRQRRTDARAAAPERRLHGPRALLREGQAREGAQRQRPRQHGRPGARVLAGHRPGAARGDATTNGHETGLTRSFHPDGQLRRATFYAEPGERASAEFTERGQLSACAAATSPAGAGGRRCAAVRLRRRHPRRSSCSTARARCARGSPTWPASACAAKSSTTTASPRCRTRSAATSAPSGAGRPRASSAGSRLPAGRARRDQAARAGVLREGHAGARPALERRRRAARDESYYLNGQPRSKAVYGEGGEARTVEITEFHDNGQRAALGASPRRAASARSRSAAPALQRQAASCWPNRATTTRAASRANAPGTPTASWSATTRCSRTARAKEPTGKRLGSRSAVRVVNPA